MLDLIQEYLPQLLAGLFPSLIAVIPVVITSIKNIKINAQVDELLKIVNDLQKGNITIGEALDSTIKQVESSKDNMLNDIMEVKKTVEESIVEDVTKLQEVIGSQIQMVDQNMGEIQVALKQVIERMMTYDNVHTLPEERQEEIPTE